MADIGALHSGHMTMPASGADFEVVLGITRRRSFIAGRRVLMAHLLHKQGRLQPWVPPIAGARVSEVTTLAVAPECEIADTVRLFRRRVPCASSRWGCRGPAVGGRWQTKSASCPFQRSAGRSGRNEGPQPNGWGPDAGPRMPAEVTDSAHYFKLQRCARPPCFSRLFT
jgi:hypothetical protein